MPEQTKRYQSWGRYPQASPARVITIEGRDEAIPFAEFPESVLAFAQGRSYGDTCLNDHGVLIDTSLLSGIIAFDQEKGVLRCESGTTLGTILDLIVPHGWFLPVTPGTKQVSVGGAIAHDVHGKNHHCAGTFGCHVRQFELLCSNGKRLLCSSSENSELFRATIGGMGLTGLILWAEFALKRVAGPLMSTENLPFANLEEFFRVASQSDRDYEYTVAWLDSAARGRKFGRGIFSRGNHAPAPDPSPQKIKAVRQKRVPLNIPAFLLSRPTIKTFNFFFYRLHSMNSGKRLTHYEPFLYPLDALTDWNRIYGRRGFLQYQCVIPFEERDALREILSLTAHSDLVASLIVLKNFGAMESPGMLSFPRAGVTLALDFPFLGDKTLRLFDEFDKVTRAAHGAVYPAKDARMSAESFKEYFPQWRDFSRYIDPRFSSSFWRRVIS